MDTRSFVIPASNRQTVEEHVAKLNKRAVKLSLPEITLTWGKAFYESRDVKGGKQNVLVLPVDVVGPLNVSYEGWQFIATLQHLPTGENVIRSITDQYDIPIKYHSCGSDCEHCQVNRYRKDTYLVRHDDSRVVQVGSSCIKDFLGGNSPDDILKKASLAADLLNFIGGASHGGGVGNNNEGIFHINTFLENTAACIRDYGWVSKSEAKNSGSKATVSYVLDNLDYQTSKVTNAEKDLASKAVAWVEAISDEECEYSEYLHNIRAIVRSGMVGLRTTGYAASIISSYNRDLAKRQPKQISSHVGMVKMREEFDLTLNNIYHGRAAYGEFFKYTFHDERGNILFWNTSIEREGFELNHKYRIRGTVKAHTEFKGVKQTEINRCETVMYYE